MAVTAVVNKPNLTKQDAQAIFQKHFGEKYQVQEWKGPFGSRDFSVIKNPFVGVSVKLDQNPNETKFVYTGYAPKWWARAMLGAVIGVFLWNGLTNEVRQFLETAPEFR